MKRKLFWVAGAISIVAVAAWVRSYVVRDILTRVDYRENGRLYSSFVITLETHRGGLEMMLSRHGGVRDEPMGQQVPAEVIEHLGEKVYMLRYGEIVRYHLTPEPDLSHSWRGIDVEVARESTRLRWGKAIKIRIDYWIFTVFGGGAAVYLFVLRRRTTYRGFEATARLVRIGKPNPSEGETVKVKR